MLDESSDPILLSSLWSSVTKTVAGPGEENEGNGMWLCWQHGVIQLDGQIIFKDETLRPEGQLPFIGQSRHTWRNWQPKWRTGCIGGPGWFNVRRVNIEIKTSDQIRSDQISFFLMSVFSFFLCRYIESVMLLNYVIMSGFSHWRDKPSKSSKETSETMSVVLSESDIPGSSLNGRNPSELKAKLQNTPQPICIWLNSSYCVFSSMLFDRCIHLTQYLNLWN